MNVARESRFFFFAHDLQVIGKLEQFGGSSFDLRLETLLLDDHPPPLLFALVQLAARKQPHDQEQGDREQGHHLHAEARKRDVGLPADRAAVELQSMIRREGRDLIADLFRGAVADPGVHEFVGGAAPRLFEQGERGLKLGHPLAGEVVDAGNAIALVGCPELDHELAQGREAFFDARQCRAVGVEILGTAGQEVAALARFRVDDQREYLVQGGVHFQRSRDALVCRLEPSEAEFGKDEDRER